MADLKAWADSIIGKTIADRYDVSAVLGMGGNGGVFLALHKLLGGRAFAVKLIIPNPLAGPMEEQEQRLAREAAMALAFVHPRAVQVRDFGFDHGNDVMYMAMDHVEGSDLAVVLADARRESVTGRPLIELGRALVITRMILDVLETAETANIVHRDLKPSNIILTREQGREDIKVLDFGLAKIVRVAGGQDIPDEDGAPSPSGSQFLAKQLTASGAIMGTVQYMAPEQARGDPVDRRADIYATGVILYEMLTGKLPHEGSNYHHLLFARAAEPVVPVETARTDLDLPMSVRAVLDQALAMKPEDRFQGASEFAAAVEESIAEAGVEPPALTGRSTRGGSTSTLPIMKPPAADHDENGKTPSKGSGYRRHARRRRIILASLVSAGMLVAATSVLLAALWGDERADMIVNGRERLEKGDIAGALAALDAADEVRPLDGEDRALLMKARAAAAIDHARVAAEAGDLAALEERLAEARGLGAEGRELAPFVRLAAAGGELARAERLVGERSYVRARAILTALPPGLPASWAEQVRRLAESADVELARAAALLGDGRAPALPDDAAALRAAETALGRFLDGFPHHPSREDARGARDVLQKRLREIRAGDEAPTGLRILTRPPGLVCRLDNRVIGRTPLETLDRLEPGPHRIEFIDPDGFESRHEVNVVRGRVADYSFDHATAVEGERAAFAKASDMGSGPAEAVVHACRRYLATFPHGAMHAEVMRILRAAERQAYKHIETLWREGAAPARGIERATSFAESFPASAHAGEVTAWLNEWRRAEREEDAERVSLERLRALLASADTVPADVRERALRKHLNRFEGSGPEARARAMLTEHLVRALPLPGRVVLATAAGPGKVALASAAPPALAITRLASGKTETTAIDKAYSVVALAAAPDGDDVFAATKTGEILLWQPSSNTLPTVIAKMPRPPTTLVAIGGGRLVVADGVRGRALILTLNNRGKITRADFASAVKRPRLGVRSADGRLVALADSEGGVALLALKKTGGTTLLWRTRVRGEVKALAFSPRAGLLAASSGDGDASETVVWSLKEGPDRPVARHGHSSGWVALLNERGLLIVGGVVVGPEPDARAVPLRIGAACVVDGSSGFFLATTADGEAVITDLSTLVRRVLRVRGER